MTVSCDIVSDTSEGALSTFPGVLIHTQMTLFEGSQRCRMSQECGSQRSFHACMSDTLQQPLVLIGVACDRDLWLFYFAA